MKSPLLFLPVLLFYVAGFAQPSTQREANCRDKCSRHGLHARVDAADYYQFPSMANYDMKYLKLDLDVEAGTTFISGTALTVATALQPLDSFNIELRDGMIVDSVFINGTKLNFQRGMDYIFIPLSPALPAGSVVSALFYYHGTPGSGVYAESNGPGDLTFTATLSESYQAREWFPAKQILKDKIDSADIWITTSSMNMVGSNGRLVAVADSPVFRKQYQWKSRHPMNYYMPSFSVGNYREYLNYAKPLAMAPDSIPVQHFILDDDTYFNSVKTNLDKTPVFIEKFSELFGLYPFWDEKYGHAHAYIGGGMEHQTMSTMSGFGSTIIAHELAHQWWGDNVTCATWNHIWLNEGFASYGAYLAVETLPALFPTTIPADYMQDIHDNVLSSPAGSVYVPDEFLFDEGRIFSGRLSYDKGAAIIHNLRFETQDDNLFFQVLENYQQQFKDSVATADDFKLVAEATTGKNFTDFFNQWYYGEGYPTFNITYIRQGSDSIILVVNQTASAPLVTPFFKGLYEFTITSFQGDTTVRAYISANDQVVKFPYNKIPTGIIVDPNNWVLNTTGTITNGGVIVPVKLTGFKAGVSGCSAVLSWKTTNDEGCKYYEVEYSGDGINFIGVATVTSKNSNSEAIYQYNYPLGLGSTHFFRLKITELAGNYQYSSITRVEKNCESHFSLAIIPNPVAGKLHLNVHQLVGGNTSLTVFDARGVVVYRNIHLLRAGDNSIDLPTENLATGTYLLRAENSKITSVEKFIKLK